MIYGGESELEDCIFCKIVGGEIPSYRVYENDNAIAFLDIAPITRGHTLVVSKTHVKGFSELQSSELPGLSSAIQKVARAIEDSLDPEGLNIFVNQGEVAGQIIPHLHIHVVPRTTGDGLEFITPRVDMSEEDFKDLSKRIIKELRNV
jgi:histidine triad (HIT) family protein